jgi:hypothetical protein
MSAGSRSSIGRSNPVGNAPESSSAQCPPNRLGLGALGRERAPGELHRLMKAARMSPLSRFDGNATSNQVGCQVTAGLPPRIAIDASCSCSSPTHRLDRCLRDPAGLARTRVEPCPGPGNGQQLDRDLHDPGLQVDQGEPRWFGTRSGHGARSGSLPLLLPADADPRPAAGASSGSTAAWAGPRASARPPRRSANPACLGERAAACTPSVLLIA